MPVHKEIKTLENLCVTTVVGLAAVAQQWSQHVSMEQGENQQLFSSPFDWIRNILISCHSSNLI